MANTGSTGRNDRKSCGLDITSCILVSVVLCLACRTSPAAHVEGKFLDDVATSGTCLAAGVEAVDLHELPAVPDTLVRQKGQEHTPSCVRDDSGEAVVADHPSDVQILDDDHLVFANESSGEFLHLVAATVGHLGVETSELDSSLVPVAASFLLSVERTRKAPLALHLSGVVLEVGDLLSGGERGQGVDAEVDTDGGLELGQRAHGLVLAEQGHVPALGGVQGYRGARRLGAFWEWPGPADVERGVHLGQRQLTVREAKSTASKLGRTTGALLLEAGVLRPLGEEIGVGGLKVAQRLLNGNAGHLVEKSKLGILLPRGERSALSRVTDGFLARGPGFRTFMQRSVVDQAATPNSSTKQDFLLGGGIEAILKPSQRHACSIAQRNASHQPRTGRRFLRLLKAAVSTPGKR